MLSIYFFAASLLSVFTTQAQRFNFTNYSIEQGLPQSQVLDIIQDNYGYIWTATQGGIARFDGNNFFSYYKKDGLSTLIDYALYHHSDGTLLIGNHYGLQGYNGRNIYSYEFDVPKPAWVKAVAGDKAGRFFFLSKLKLFAGAAKEKCTIVSLFKEDKVSALRNDLNGNVYAAVIGKGIYQWTNSQWSSICPIYDTSIVIKAIHITAKNQVLLLSGQKLYTVSGGLLLPVFDKGKDYATFLCVSSDNIDRIWIGTTKGALLLDSSFKAQRISEAEGLTDNSIHKIICDREANLWFASDGDGIFRLTNSPVSQLVGGKTFQGNIIMGIAAENENSIWIGSSEFGLQKYNGQVFIPYRIPSSKLEAQKTNSLLLDDKNRLWIGTIGGGIWLFSKGHFNEILTTTGEELNYTLSFYKDSQNTIWACTTKGIFYFSNGKMNPIEGMKLLTLSATEIGKDSLYAATTSGLLLVRNKNNVSKVDVPFSNIGTINCFARLKDKLLLGTEDNGVLFWNIRQNKVVQCSTNNGLISDFIFSLFVDNDSTIFAGTGRGLSKIILSNSDREINVQNFVAPKSQFGPEFNLDVATRISANKIWFGTTKGILEYNKNENIIHSTPPIVYLTSATILVPETTKENHRDTILAWAKLPYNLQLPYNQNNLSFTLSALHFSNPLGIRFMYKLEGAQMDYVPLKGTDKVVLSNLSPGKYRLLAYAVTNDGVKSSNSIDFPFEIDAPYYQKPWFLFFSILSLVGIGILIQHSRTKAKAKRALALEAIRAEDQRLIQERTAEDLHDDLGNKITRISILADVLNSKMPNDDIEQKRIVHQIKENAESLYLGTKDIIWSLTPGNDTLYAIVKRMEAFGMHLFEESSIDFHDYAFSSDLNKVMVPIQIGRNLVMIVKEAFNNIAKHSQASNAYFKCKAIDSSTFEVEISDDGKGIDLTSNRKGNGLSNMQKRAERMGATFTIFPNQNSGTKLLFVIKIPQ